jgi:cytochrome b561
MTSDHFVRLCTPTGRFWREAAVRRVCDLRGSRNPAAAIRDLHAALAHLFFATFLAHFGAALFHGLIRRDGVLGSMASWR